MILHRLLYISTARQPLGPAERDALLTTSRRNNAAAQVTGLLIVGGRRFLQALEGPEPAVQATFARIDADDRHYGIVILADHVIERRSFPDWAMGYRDGGTVPSTAGPAGAINDLIAPIGDPTIRAYVEGFAKSHLMV